ncbi:unnamed protein product [Moneuplotes crassus]|uniref:Uncharacterized protein n=1 Tax=Euplotes crassus TaxID=5936 RepID=A0AAD1XAE5_EUPCR|nr:unnamed protein product [Moneuplotes crassus]
MSDNSLDNFVEVKDDDLDKRIRARAAALRKESESKFRESNNSSIGSLNDEDDLQKLVKQHVNIGFAERQDISQINMQREDDDDPEEFQEILTEFPEEFEEDSLNIIKDEDDHKIEELKNEHERTLDSYNRGMKKANQLSITGYSNYSDLNNSKNTEQEHKNNTVLFGNNFVNISKGGSEGNSLVKNKSKDEGLEQKSPNVSLRGDSKEGGEFSMKRQIEDFIIGFERTTSACKQAEVNHRDDQIILDKIPEENSEQNEAGKTSSQRDSVKNEEYEENSLFSSVMSMNGEIRIEDDATNNRVSMVNKEWDNIVREVSSNNPQNQPLGLTAQRSTPLANGNHQKTTHLRDNDSRKYMRNHPLEVGHTDPRYKDIHSKTILQSSDFSEIESEKEREEAKNIVKIEIIIIMLRNRNLHKNMISDFEQNRCRIYLLNILKKDPDCEEAHYGISQIYFSLGIHNKALEHIKKALTSNPREPQYLCLKALYLYTIMQCNEKEDSYEEYFKECENTCLKTLKYDQNNLTALYILLVLSCEARDRANKAKDICVSPEKPAEEYAVRIKEISDYLGYIAWSEIYICAGKVTDAEEVLEDLCYTFPTFPHAFLKLWDHRFGKEDYIKSIEPIEDIFLRIADFHTIPEIRIAIVPLMYAKTLMKLNQYVYAFELLQNEFCKRPVYTVFLYFLGKFALSSGEKRFKGTAIGILQECMRSCVSQRKAKILYYLGNAYKDRNQPMKAFDYYEQSIEYFRNKNYTYGSCNPEIMKEMKSFMKDFYELSQLRHLIENSAFKIKRQRKTKKNYKVPQDEVEKLRSASKKIARDDKCEGWMLRGKIITEIEDNQNEAVKYFMAMIEKVPYNIQGYIQFFKFLKQRNLKGKLDYVTSKMMKNIENPSVPTDDWVEAHMVRAESLVILKKYSKAISVLEKLVYIIPPLPIPGLKYLAKLEKKQSSKGSPKNEEGDIKISYGNIEATGKEETKMATTMNLPSKQSNIQEEEEKGEITINVVPCEEPQRDMKNNELNFTERSKNAGYRNARPFSSSLFFSANRGNAGSRFEGSIFGTEVHRESMMSRKSDIYHFDIENFSVSTELKFLYEIGKICADSGIQPENGIEALLDFIKILNYYKDDMEQMIFKKMFCDSNLKLAKNYIYTDQRGKAKEIAESIYDEAVKLDSRKDRNIGGNNEGYSSKEHKSSQKPSSQGSYRAELDYILDL